MNSKGKFEIFELENHNEENPYAEADSVNAEISVSEADDIEDEEINFYDKNNWEKIEVDKIQASLKGIYINNNICVNVDKTLSEPEEIFDKLFSLDMLDIIVEETNRYIYQFISKNIDYLNQHKYSKAHRWKNTTNEEIRRFIGVEILMSLLPLQNIRYYWKKDELLETNVRNFMSEDRFNLLKKFLHINNNEDCDKSDRLYKIRVR